MAYVRKKKIREEAFAFFSIYRANISTGYFLDTFFGSVYPCIEVVLSILSAYFLI